VKSFFGGVSAVIRFISREKRDKAHLLALIVIFVKNLGIWSPIDFIYN